MIRKEFIEVDGQPRARMTFTVPNGLWVDALYLVGDFNAWQRVAHLFSIMLVLTSG